MITKEQLDKITARIKEKVWRNPLVMCNLDTDDEGYALDILTSLHNLLYECVTGEKYNYAFHWANKIGSWVEDNVFDDIIEGNENNGKEE